MDNVNIDILLNEKDIYLYKRSFISKTKNVFFFYGAFALIEIYLITRYYEDIFKLSLVIVLPLIFALGFFFQLKKDSRKAFRSNKYLQKKQVFTFSEDGLSVLRGNKEIFTKWIDMNKAVEYKHNLSIFISSDKAYIIPLRCIDDNQKNIILELIKKIPTVKKK